MKTNRFSLIFDDQEDREFLDGYVAYYKGREVREIAKDEETNSINEIAEEDEES